MMELKLKCEYVTNEYAFGMDSKTYVEDNGLTSIETLDKKGDLIREVYLDIRVDDDNLKVMFNLIHFGILNFTIELRRPIQYFNLIDGCQNNIIFEAGMYERYGSFVEEHDETPDYIRWNIVNKEEFQQAYEQWSKDNATDNTTSTKE